MARGDGKAGVWAKRWLDGVRRAATEGAEVRRRIKQRECYGGPTESLLEAARSSERKTEAAFAVVDLIEGLVGHEKAASLECYYIEGLSWSEVARQVSASKASVIRWRDVCVDVLDEIGECRVAEGAGYGERGLP